MLNVLYYVKLKNMMKRAFIKRISGMLKKDMSRLDYRRRALYCYAGEKPLNEMKYKDVCVFNCYVCGEEFEGTKVDVTKGIWHASCSRMLNCKLKTREKLTLDEVDARAERCWMGDKNGKVFTPHVVGFGQRKKYWYKCDICEHEFQLAYDGMFRNQIWCSYCSPTFKKLCGDIECNWCWNNSVARNLDEYNLSWLPTNDRAPHEVARGASNKVCHFHCNSCNHDISIPPGKLHCKNVNTCCKYCTHQALCHSPACEMCYANSALFALKDREDLTVISHTPDELRMKFRASNKKVTCQCSANEKHVWDVTISNLVCHKKSCPVCVNKTERIIFDELLKIYNDQVSFQQTFDWCVNTSTNRHLKYDMAILNLKIFIECMGIQHEKEHAFFNQRKSLEEIQYWDNYKIERALENGYSLIKLNQETIWKDHQKNKRDWVEKLVEAIEYIKTLDKPISYGYAY